MKITKYEHACFVLEDQGKKLVIDPGGFTPSFGELDNIEAVVVTHVHPDHFDPRHVKDIVAANPDVKIYTVREVAEQLKEQNVVLAQPGERVHSGPFVLEFRGEVHALIHQSLPQPHNTAVLVNDAFFYPGDSFTLPDKPVEVLAIASSAPWMKVSEAIDYLGQVQAKQCIPTHNGLLSQNGHSVMNRLLGNACKQRGITYTYLQPGESLTVAL